MKIKQEVSFDDLLKINRMEYIEFNIKLKKQSFVSEKRRMEER